MALVSDSLFNGAKGQVAGYILGNTLGGTAVRKKNIDVVQPNTQAQQNVKTRGKILSDMRKQLLNFYTIMYSIRAKTKVGGRKFLSQWNWFFKGNNLEQNFTVDAGGAVTHFKLGSLEAYNLNLPIGNMSVTEAGGDFDVAITGLTPSRSYKFMFAGQKADFSFLEIPVILVGTVNSSGVLNFTIEATQFLAGNVVNVYGTVLDEQASIVYSYHTTV